MITPTKTGALAALGCGLSYIAGFALLVSYLAPMGYGSADKDFPAMIRFAADNQGLMVAWNSTIYIANGLCLAVLAIALYGILSKAAPTLSKAVLVFGALWATLVIAAGMVANVGLAEAIRLFAQSPDDGAALFRVVYTIETGLGGGNEIVGAVWALSIALAGWATGRLPRGLTGLSFVIALAGGLSVLPSLSESAGAVFGLGYIVWFLWMAAVLARIKAD